MFGGLKSSLAFAGVTLFGAAILAANFSTWQQRDSRGDGGYNDAEYIPPSSPETAYSEGESEIGDSFDEAGDSEFASDDELVDDTAGFDPSADAVTRVSGDNGEQAESSTASSDRADESVEDADASGM